jgi:hypothetical protein
MGVKREKHSRNGDGTMVDRTNNDSSKSVKTYKGSLFGKTSMPSTSHKKKTINRRLIRGGQAPFLFKNIQNKFRLYPDYVSNF